ncbi:Proton-dependent oligopeptide transporter family [Sesbania bispinosa]|nr:Proton-dependent oligopeptide transporter family [Sesbania bispinosa]
MESVTVTNSPPSHEIEHEQTPAPSASASLPKEPGGWRSVKYIIANESFEKLASMSLISNITVYLLTNYNLGGIFVVNVVSDPPLWLYCISSGYVDHDPNSRYTSIETSSVQGPHCQQPQGWQLGALFAGLGLLSIGAGGIRPCNIAFGADQFDTRTEKGKAQLESFFNWWYFTFTIALIIALTGVVYIQTNVNWTLGFAIPTICLAFSITIFLFGRHTYICKAPQGSIFTDMAKVIVAACRKRKLKAQGRPFYVPAPELGDSDMDNKRLVPTDKFKFFDKAAIISAPSELNDQGMSMNTWRLCSLQKVENFKCFLGILPVWVTGICVFIVMDQQNTFGVLQIAQTNRSLGPHFKVPPGWMNLASMIALSIWICIYERIYIPLTRIITKKATRLTIRQRIRIGILLSILCMLVAAIVEKKRRDSALRHGSLISPTSFALLLPQFALSGLNEAFAAVAIMEFFTMQMPESMRTVAGAVFFLSLSIANYIGSLIVTIIHKVTAHRGRTPWLGGHDLNKNRLDYYYYVIAALAALNFVYFNFFASDYLISSEATGITEMQQENSIAGRMGESFEVEDEENVLGINGTR